MDMYLIICLVIIVIVMLLTLYFRQTKQYDYWTKRKVVNKKPIFPFGCTKEIVLAQTSIGQGYDKLYKEFQFERYFGIIDVTEPLLVVKDLNLVKAILVSDFDHFSVRTISGADPKEYILKHVINMSGQEWKDMRARLSPAFTSGKMKSLFPLMLKCGSQLEHRLQVLVEQKQSVEITDLFARFTIDVIASNAFGIETDSLNNQNCTFFKIVGTMLRTDKLRFFKRFLINWIPLLVKVFSMRLVPCEVTNILTNTVRQSVLYRKGNNLKRNDFLDSLINSENDEAHLKSELSIEQMTAQAFVFFIAGYTTDTSILSFCIYELARNHEIQEKVFQDIQSNKPKADVLTYESLKMMTYLDQVILEALRLYGSGQIIVRTCTRPYKVPNSHLILETGRKVVIPTYSIHHDPKYFPDPYLFKPERFSSEGKNKMHPFAFLPFGEGPRNCIGKNFGLLQIKIGIATVIDNYKVDLDPDHRGDIEIDKRNIVVTPANPVFIKFKKRMKTF